jgi:hypothetical protein
MEMPESGLSTSSIASEMMPSKGEADREANKEADGNLGAHNTDAEPGKEEKKSFKFKLTVFMLCFVSVVVAMASSLSSLTA